MKQNGNLIKILSVLLVAVGFILGVVVLARNSKKTEELPSLTITGEEIKLKVESNGSFKFVSGNDVWENKFSESELAELVSYLKKNGIKSISLEEESDFWRVEILSGDIVEIYFIPKGEGVIEKIIEIIQTGGLTTPTPAPTGDGGFSFDLKTATPTSSPTVTQPGSTITPRPTTPGSTPPPDCPLWLLSYCVYPRTPAPQASPTPMVITPSPVPDCSFWKTFLKAPTIISNTFCLNEE